MNIFRNFSEKFKGMKLYGIFFLPALDPARDVVSLILRLDSGCELGRWVLLRFK